MYCFFHCNNGYANASQCHVITKLSHYSWGIGRCVRMKGTALGADLAEDNVQLLQCVGNRTLTDGVPEARWDMNNTVICDVMTWSWHCWEYQENVWVCVCVCVCVFMKSLKMTNMVSKVLSSISSRAMNQSKYRYVSHNDGDTYWEMRRWAISSLCERHWVYLHKPR